MNFLKKSLIMTTLIVLILAPSIFPVFAYDSGDIVINEIAWAGTVDNANDEWIELYNTSSVTIDLSGWIIEDDGEPSSALAGQIAPHGYFLIEDKEEATSKTADLIIGLSLANSGDSLSLKDSSGKIIDTVNSAGGEWFAGDGKTKSSMERIDPKAGGDVANNWSSAAVGNGAKNIDGKDILGTPGSANSVYAGGVEVKMRMTDANLGYGEIVDLIFETEEVNDLYAYGMEVNYDPTLMTFVEGKESDFLKKDGTATSFFAALENGNAGKVVVGDARLLSPAVGIDGEGELFRLSFEIMNENMEVDFSFGSENFLSDSNGDMEARFSNTDLLENENLPEDEDGNVQTIAEPQEAEISLGTERYSLKIQWENSEEEVDKYIVSKKMPDGSFVKIGESEENFLLDDNLLVVNVTYDYQIAAEQNGAQSNPIEISGMEVRGLAGDSNRSDRVDGRDVENLARSYASEFSGESYDILADSNYDGMIDGSDLIDIGANFGLTY